MDFREPDVSDFVYHCHILDHEDGGMMAIIRVKPRDASSDAPPQVSRGGERRANQSKVMI